MKLKFKLIVFILILTSAHAFPQDITYIIKPKATSVELGELYNIEVFLKNNTDKELLICKCNIKGKITFGKLIQGKKHLFLDEYETIEPPKEADFILIKPDEIIMVEEMGFGKNYFISQGQWYLQIEETYTGAANIARKKSWSGTIKSNEIIVQIR